MDTLNYRKIIESILLLYTKITYANMDAHNEVLFDHEHDRYCVLSVGWEGVRRVHGCLIHIDLIDNKVWVQRDDTEDGVTYELERAGIPKSDIVLGFKDSLTRQYTGYAVA